MCEMYEEPKQEKHFLMELHFCKGKQKISKLFGEIHDIKSSECVCVLLQVVAKEDPEKMTFKQRT